MRDKCAGGFQVCFELLLGRVTLLDFSAMYLQLVWDESGSGVCSGVDDCLGVAEELVQAGIGIQVVSVHEFHFLTVKFDQEVFQVEVGGEAGVMALVLVFDHKCRFATRMRRVVFSELFDLVFAEMESDFF